MSNNRQNIAIWGGIEYTLNRLKDEYYDQIVKSGHDLRIEDLDLFADLGIKAIRYPVLWEKLAPKGFNNIDWSWTDERLSRLRELNIKPIISLIHHGSGPLSTSLLHDDFHQNLAHFAYLVAQRYPWVDMYTPVNEPLTTARFSGLYGLWYPHKHDDNSFLRAFINQAKAVIYSMREIRKINPQALLIQTEDLGKVYSTAKMEQQANYENSRRWLTFDLLTNKITKEHSLWSYLITNGIKQKELEEFRSSDKPNILGINHYVTSERFLDDNFTKYPLKSHSYNGREKYADLEAVRVLKEGITGIMGVIEESWERYRQSIAITEAHLCSTREEQLRWLKDEWDACVALKKTGIDIKALTVWSMLGAYDWNSLVTKNDYHYESGVFDLRSPKPRPTLLATMIKSLVKKSKYEHPVLSEVGWWLDDKRRYVYEPVSDPKIKVGLKTKSSLVREKDNSKSLLIIGATGTLGYSLHRLCELRGLKHNILTRAELDITDSNKINQTVEKLKPWGIINAAGYVNVEKAEVESSLCYQLNTTAAYNLAVCASNNNIPYLGFSSDLVFSGKKTMPYVEDDLVDGLNVYGKSKIEMENKILGVVKTALIIRTSAFFGPWDKYNFATKCLTAFNANKPVFASENIVSPTYIIDLVNTSLDLFLDQEKGIWHLANQGEISWVNFARYIAKIFKISKPEIIIKENNNVKLPKYSSLGSIKSTIMPSLEKAIDNYVKELTY